MAWHLVGVIGLCGVLWGCGGGGALGESNDGRLVTRSTVALRGTASLGAEPALSGGQCVAVTLEEQVQHTATLGGDGSFLLIRSFGVHLLLRRHRGSFLRLSVPPLCQLQM